MEESIAATVARAPGFFVGAPLVLDFEDVRETISAAAAAESCAVVTRLGMVPVGVANLGNKKGFEGPPMLSLASPAAGASLQWKAHNAAIYFILVHRDLGYYTSSSSPLL